MAVFVGWLFAHEPVTARMLTGAAIILLSVALVSLRKGAPDVASQQFEQPLVEA